MLAEVHSIRCADGVMLYSELLVPTSPIGVVQINSGTATQRGVYRKLALFLAKRGFVCCLWDYRGNGASRTGSLRHSSIRYADYGLLDMPAVKRELTTRFPDLPLFILGHSTGGQQIGFMPNWRGIRGAIMLGVSAAHYAHMPMPYRLQAEAFFRVFAPLSIRWKGYVAASAIGLMEDLPAGVAKEWHDWLTVEDYFFDSKFYGKTVPIGAFQEFDFPIRNYHATDDSISTPPNIHNFWKHVRSEQGITFTRISPADVGLKKIDHFGYFKSALQDVLWEDISMHLTQWATAATDT